MSAAVDSRHRLRREDGVALVEFALIAPVFFALLFGMIDFGRALNSWLDATHVANEAARFAVVNRVPGGVSPQQYAKSSAATTEPMTVCLTFPNGAAVGNPVTVEAKVVHSWLEVVGLDVASTTITGSATMRLEATPSYAAGCA